MYNICREGDSLPRSWLPRGTAYNHKYAQRSQAERSGGARGESQPWQPSREHWHSPAPHTSWEGRGSAPLHLPTTAPQHNPAPPEGPLPARGDRDMLQLGRVRGHLCILWHWAGPTVAKPFPADICPIYFKNPPTVTPGNLFLCFPTES